MATYTTNLSLIKPAGTDKIRIAQINQNMDTIDAAIGAVGNTSLQTQVTSVSDSMSAVESGIAIVSNNNTHVAITSGQYVYVKNHATLSEGLYRATQAIATNGTLTLSNVTPESAGGLNSLNEQIANMVMEVLHISDSVTVSANSVETAQFQPIAKIGYDIVGCLFMCNNNYLTTGFAKSGGSYYYTIANSYSSALTTSIDAILFYKKNS